MWSSKEGTVISWESGRFIDQRNTTTSEQTINVVSYGISWIIFAAVVGSFTPVYFFVYGNDQFADLSAPFQNAMPLETNESAKPSDVLSSPNSLSNFSQLV